MDQDERERRQAYIEQTREQHEADSAKLADEIEQREAECADDPIANDDRLRREHAAMMARCEPAGAPLARETDADVLYRTCENSAPAAAHAAHAVPITAEYVRRLIAEVLVIERQRATEVFAEVLAAERADHKLDRDSLHTLALEVAKLGSL